MRHASDSTPRITEFVERLSGLYNGEYNTVICDDLLMNHLGVLILPEESGVFVYARGKQSLVGPGLKPWFTSP